MRMKCDKNYFHVTPEHLTSDGLVQHRPLGLFRSPCEVIATKLLFNRKKNQVWILKNVFWFSSKHIQKEENTNQQ